MPIYESLNLGRKFGGHIGHAISLQAHHRRVSGVIRALGLNSRLRSPCVGGIHYRKAIDVVIYKLDDGWMRAKIVYQGITANVRLRNT